MDVQTETAATIVKALDAFGISSDWEVAAAVRALHPTTTGPPIEFRGRREIEAFKNLVVGTIAEGVFRKRHLEPLKPLGYDIVDYAARGENRDFGVRRNDQELPINVKTASTVFRKAKATVGLEPLDCIPISTYKAYGAAKKVPELVYVDLVDFDLREKADGYITALTGEAALLWNFFAWYGGKGAKKAQDAFITRLFGIHESALEAFVPDDSKFRVISAQRVLAIVREHPERCPGLGIKGAGTGAFNAEVNVHVSVQKETRPWSEVADLLRTKDIETILNMITRTETSVIRSPLL